MNRGTPVWALLSAEEAAEEVGISLRRLRQLVDEGRGPEMDYVPLGGARWGFRFRLDRVLAWDLVRQKSMAPKHKKSGASTKRTFERKRRVAKAVEDALKP